MSWVFPRLQFMKLPHAWTITFFILQTVTRTDLKICWKNAFQNGEKCIEICRFGSFNLPGMGKCHDCLTCDDIHNKVQMEHLIAEGIVKSVHLASWNGHKVVYSKLTNPVFKNDFQNHIIMLKAFSSYPYVTRFLGSCNDVVITDYHELGDARHFHQIFLKQMGKLAPIHVRFNMCINYVQILMFLHNSPLGTRVMCDSNSLEKTLSQFLLRDDMTLIVNDLDALPEVLKHEGRGIKCGHQQLFGDFVAPEQRWPYMDREFIDSDMPYYDEKSDIWKIPDICLWFLGDDNASEIVHFHLYKLHKRCKNNNPQLRPSAIEVIEHYTHIWDTLIKGNIKISW